MSAAVRFALPLVQAFHPASFLERGVAVPFTTPLLAGVRARRAGRGGIEYVVPNPSGGRGVYVLGWSGVSQICRPTVHDTRLNAHLAALPALTPAEIRRAACDVAGEGLAGREAQAAALAAAAAERRDRLTANFRLLLALAGPTEPPGPEEGPGRSAARERQARLGVAQIALRLGCPPETVTAAIEALAGVFAGVGLPGQAPPARLPRLLARLRGLREGLGSSPRSVEAGTAARAALVVAAADITLACAGRILSETQDLAADMAKLLRRWNDAPRSLAEHLARPDWLLDGWEPVCLLWSGAGTEAERHAALAEMASRVPLLPRQVSEWMGTEVDVERLARCRTSVPLEREWRMGAQFERIARNERLRALVA